MSVIAPGYQHICVLANGGVRCWGEMHTVNWEMVTIPPATRYNQCLVGYAVSALMRVGIIALRGNSNVLCWGKNDKGHWEMARTDRSQPVAVDLAHLLLLSALAKHLCLIKGWHGQVLGQFAVATAQTPAQSSTPLLVAGLTGVNAIALVPFTPCPTASAVKCWGDNGFGQLGNGTTSASATPVDTVWGCQPVN